MTSVTYAAEIREARAAAARPGTVAADPTIEIRDTPDLHARTRTHRERNEDVASLRDAKLAENELAGAPLFVVRSSTPKPALVWRGGTGMWFRRGGAVRIQRWPQPDGPRSFVVSLHEGANKDDLEFLLYAVERARRGEGLVEWDQVTAPWADELTFKLAYTSAQYEDPYTTRDLSPKVAPCDDPVCVDKWHEEYGEHTIDTVERKLVSGGGQYVVSVYRLVDEDRWKVSVFTDEFYGSPEDVAMLVSDLQWMAAECRRANEGTAERAAA
jgi:hypothetical protein